MFTTRTVGKGLLAAAGAALLLTACTPGGTTEGPGDGPSDGPAEPTHISVVVAQAKDTNGLWWKVGQEEGIFEKHGIIVDEVLAAEGGGDTLQMLLAGDLPFGQIATAAAVNAHQAGAPIKVVAGAAQSPFEIAWATLKDSELQTIEDLKDKVWGFTNAGSVTEAMSYLVPAHAGLDVDQVQRVATGGLGAGIALLESGDVDVTFVTPIVAAAQKDALRVVVSSDEYVPQAAMNMIVASEKYLASNPEVAKSLLLALSECLDWIYDNFEDAVASYSELAELEPDVAKEILQAYIDKDAWQMAFNPTALEAAGEGLMYTDGITDIDWESLLTDEYLPEGMKGTIP